MGGPIVSQGLLLSQGNVWEQTESASDVSILFYYSKCEALRFLCLRSGENADLSWILSEKRVKNAVFRRGFEFRRP